MYIGIDGGGSKTEAYAIDEEGNRLCSLLAGPTNPHASSPESAVQELIRLLDGIFDKLDNSQHLCKGLCLAMSGISETTEKRFITAALQSYQNDRGYAFPVEISSEGEISLMAATGHVHGVLVISGTGSIVYGFSPDGDKFRAGGWGHLLGDEGSGYQIGLRTLRMVMRSYDGVIPPTRLTPAVVHSCALSGPQQLREYIYRPEVGKAEIAAFARVCIAAAEDGDPAAAEIIIGEAEALAHTTAALMERYPKLQQYQIVTAGSIFKHSRLFARHFQAKTGELVPSAAFKETGPTLSPAAGAALLAKQLFQGA
ncbi:BadF/BadG/BcrA/BcrD ATPase family protein [Paenibacillus caui]|uniref:BadF/BadG/BcrA/BcrD ATPase family protein n=1 Tax=Paenibacillus caui TaxID=2873927 RepID=UPI0030808411